MARDIRRSQHDRVPLSAELLGKLKDRLGDEAAEALTTGGDFLHHNGRVTFDMLHVSVQEYLIRLDPKDLEELKWAARLGFWVRWTLRGAKFAVWAFTGGVAAALIAGENLHKLIGMISSAITALQGFGK